MSGLRYTGSSALIAAALLAMAALGAVGMASAAEADKPAKPAAAQAEAQPIVITSESLVANKKDNTAEFSDSVVAKSGDMTLYAKWMKVHYTQAGKLQRIEARGDVKLLKGTQVLTSEEADFEVADNKITFTGNPRAVDGNSVLTGTKMIYLTVEERFMVEGGRVLIDRGHEGAILGNSGAAPDSEKKRGAQQ